MDDNQYKTVADGLRYLASMGWKASSKSFYRHISQRKISDKPWTQEDLDRYAGEFLNPMVRPNPAGTKALRGAAHELVELRKKN